MTSPKSELLGDGALVPIEISSLILKFLTTVLYCFSLFVVLVTKRLQQIIRRGTCEYKEQKPIQISSKKKGGAFESS